MTDQPEALAAQLKPLRPIVERTANVDFNGRDLFLGCLTSSFVKAFEFVELTTQLNPVGAFFLVPALRGITEEIIVLRFLSRFLHEDRELVLKNLMNLELYKKLEQQDAFFRTVRPFQPVLGTQNWDAQVSKDDLRDFWRTNGWPNFKG